jgi:6-phosphogluconolactonase (cycloisomerase 2 family)
MRKAFQFGAGASAFVGLAAWVAPIAFAHAAAAAPPPHNGADHVVFVQTDNTAGNQVVAYDRANDGTLTFAHAYDTGGLGGVLNGSVVDHLASQGSLSYDTRNALLYAVNAGSDTVSVFSVDGDQLTLRQVLDSGGSFPVSIAVHNDLVFVLNARDGGSITGYRAAGGKLHPIERSTRSLGLDVPADTSEFTHTPGQVAFTPDGSQVVVTTKANGNQIDVFAIGPDGRPSNAPTVNTEAGTVPFAVAFDAQGHLLVANAGTNAVAAYTLDQSGSVTLVDTKATGQAATCWVAPAGGFFYASNAGSGSVSSYDVGASGHLDLLGTTSTDPGTVDASATTDGLFLYVQTGAKGIVDGFRVNRDGSLTPIGTVTVPGAVGGEGIVAS